MDEPVIQSHGLGLYPLRPKHIIPLYNDLSEENVRELQVVYKTDPLEALLQLINVQMVFVVERDGRPLAVTGIDEEGCMWALFTKSMKKNWVRFARASTELIRFYHHFYDEIYCQVWTENEMIHQWLAHLEFEADALIKTDNAELVQFVRCKTEETNVYSFLSRPVMH